MVPIPFSPPRFDIDNPSALEYLKTEGYVVFKNVLPVEEIETGKDLMWK